MKFKIFIACMLAHFANLSAQTSAPTTVNTNPGTLSGKVVDKKTNESIPYASVTVKDGTTVVSGAITKENGSFIVTNLTLKELTVEVQFMGYKKYTKNFSLSNNDKSANLNIALEEEATQLDEVSVVKERSTIEQKIDRKVVNVGKDLIASGTTASEILNNVPTVSIDPQTKELSLRGNSNVRVLIDGKPSNIEASQLLQQIPSSSIKQVELITNPSAKYNPEGMSGIINIILHKNANTGFNGSINTGVTFGITPKTNSALNLNYKVGKVNFYTNYGFNHGINANHGNVNSFNPTRESLQLFEFSNKNNSHLFKFGVDYYIDDKNTLSVYTNQNLTHVDGFGNSIVDYRDNNTIFFDDTPSGIILRRNRDSRQDYNNENENKNQTYDLVYKHDFAKKGQTLEMQINYSKTKNNENTDYLDTVFEPTESIQRDNIIEAKTDYTQINLDYTHPLSETASIETGAESRIQSTGSNFNNVSGSYFANNKFDFLRDIHAIYFNYKKQWGKWSGQIGARAESYSLKADFETKSTNTSENAQKSVKDEIFTVYPSLFFTYAPSEKNSFNFNYSRRVDRPSIGQINPIREWTTLTVESRGNPDLEPQFTNSFEANYTRISKIGSITAGVFYRRINDEISRVSYNDPNDINRRILSFDNFKDNNAYGIEANANLKFTKWWSANTSADAYFKTVRGTVQNANTNEYEYAEVDVTTFNARINNTFTATKKLRFQLFGMYRGRDLSLQFARKQMYKADIGTTYNVFNNKGTITLRYNDIFKNMRFAFDGSVPYKQNGAFYWESQTFYVGFNYNFGGGKNRALQRKQRDANETQGGGGGLF
ncbi:TonB-dependent receptor domain-containing protein [Flavobacterium terrae]|uniref:Outer membrane receptor proteins, mostly Fe transport n=1 Tax=Flavobacterium terrae TaxID=415425 RepID=A0A1M6D946_9FLAO|nr:TonB-dependent receptor [Flavobacterium terrae]SHI69776.1 Outer membrane receptor proteins, mostly Fe transport [Flavobacterium terrae]